MTIAFYALVMSRGHECILKIQSFLLHIDLFVHSKRISNRVYINFRLKTRLLGF